MKDGGNLWRLLPLSQRLGGRRGRAQKAMPVIGLINGASEQKYEPQVGSTKRLLLHFGG